MIRKRTPFSDETLAFMLTMPPSHANGILNEAQTYSFQRAPYEELIGRSGLIYVPKPFQEIQGLVKLGTIQNGTAEELAKLASPNEREMILKFLRSAHNPLAMSVEMAQALEVPIPFIKIRELVPRFSPGNIRMLDERYERLIEEIRKQL